MTKNSFVKRFYFLISSIMTLALSGFCWGSAHAQDTQSIHIDTLEIQLLPEYEEDSMLVIWKMALSEDTSLPRELMLKIPAEAEIRKLSLVNQNGDKLLINAEGEAIAIGDWQNIRLTTNSLEILVEYIDPNLIEEDNQRRYVFNWFSAYTVSSISIKAYQPTGISDIETHPPLAEAPSTAKPITQYSGVLGSVSANEYFSFSLSYTRGRDNPSYPKLNVVPAASIDETTTGRSASPLSVILWLLAVALSILIMVGSYSLWFRKNMLEKRDRTYYGVGIMNPEKQVTFCHECGMRSQAGDNYCRNCGTGFHQSSQMNRPPQT
jgi:hypothetical protein